MNLLLQMLVGRGAEGATLNLMNLCSLTVFCLLTASMSLFIDKCFQKGMIFRKYYNLITYWFWLPKKEVKLAFSQITIFEIKDNEQVNFFVNENTNVMQSGGRFYRLSLRPVFISNNLKWLFKILGGCVFCCGTWIYIISTLLVVVANYENVLSFKGYSFALIGILGIGLNYFWIEVLLKIKK